MISILASAFGVLLVLAILGYGIVTRLPTRTGRVGVAVFEMSPRVEHVYYGTTLIDDGYDYYPDWSAMMLREFDDSIEASLPRYYRVAKLVAQRPHSEWSSLITDEMSKPERVSKSA